MTLVTLQEARDRLPELIGLMAAGEKIVIADGEKWIAALSAPPPMPPTPEEEAAMRERIKQDVREMTRELVQCGRPIPEDIELRKLLEKGV